IRTLSARSSSPSLVLSIYQWAYLAKSLLKCFLRLFYYFSGATRHTSCSSYFCLIHLDDNGTLIFHFEFDKSFHILLMLVQFIDVNTLMVEPQQVVDRSPRGKAFEASIWLSCIYEKKRYKHSTKDGCLQTILPKCGVHVKRASRARKYCQSWQEKAAI